MAKKAETAAQGDLVVVESPSKARTLERMLGPGYVVEASYGHIRDLPKSQLGIDLKTFEPEYVVPDDLRSMPSWDLGRSRMCP